MATVNIAAASIARIIVEEAIEGAEFLNLITSLPPDFLGDVLLISAPGRAFLSSHMEGGARFLYLLETEAEIDQYLDMYRLREDASDGLLQRDGLGHARGT